MVLLHEELGQRQQQAEFLDQGAAGSTGVAGVAGYRHLGALPRAVAAFVKELVLVGSAEKRWALWVGCGLAGHGHLQPAAAAVAAAASIDCPSQLPAGHMWASVRN